MNNTEQPHQQGGETHTEAWSCPCSPSDGGALGGRCFAGKVTPALLCRATIPRRVPRESILTGDNPNTRRGSGGGPRVPGALPRGRGRSLSPRGGRGMWRSARQDDFMRAGRRSSCCSRQVGCGPRGPGTASGRAEALRPGCGRWDVRGLDPEKVSSPAVISLDHAEQCFSARLIMGFASQRGGLPLRHSAGELEPPLELQ